MDFILTPNDKASENKHIVTNCDCLPLYDRCTACCPATCCGEDCFVLVIMFFMITFIISLFATAFLPVFIIGTAVSKIDCVKCPPTLNQMHLHKQKDGLCYYGVCATANCTVVSISDHHVTDIRCKRIMYAKIIILGVFVGMICFSYTISSRIIIDNNSEAYEQDEVVKTRITKKPFKELWIEIAKVITAVYLSVFLGPIVLITILIIVVPIGVALLALCLILLPFAMVAGMIYLIYDNCSPYRISKRVDTHEINIRSDAEGDAV